MHMKSNWDSPYRPEESKRQYTVTLTDLDFADDIALLSNKIEQAQSILSRVQRE